MFSPCCGGRICSGVFHPGTSHLKEIQGVVTLGGFQDVLPSLALELWFHGTSLNPQGRGGEVYFSFFSESERTQTFS